MTARRRARALIAMVAADAALKAGAWAFLRPRPAWGSAFGSALGPFRLGYVENASGFGFGQSRLLERYGVSLDDGFIVCTLAIFVGLALLVLFWKRIRGPAWIKAGLAVVAYFALASTALGVHELLRLSLSDYARRLLRALGPLAVALSLYLVASKPYTASAATIFLAGTIGNCASLLLPPFAVIDYLGLYRPRLGFFVYADAADLYIAAALAMLAALPFVLLARAAARRRGHESH